MPPSAGNTLGLLKNDYSLKSFWKASKQSKPTCCHMSWLLGGFVMVWKSLVIFFLFHSPKPILMVRK